MGTVSQEFQELRDALALALPGWTEVPNPHQDVEEWTFPASNGVYQLVVDGSGQIGDSLGGVVQNQTGISLILWVSVLNNGAVLTDAMPQLMDATESVQLYLKQATRSIVGSVGAIQPLVSNTAAMDQYLVQQLAITLNSEKFIT